jgi:hypothetical protein
VGNTTKERVTFSALMTLGMVIIMCSYNVILAVGFTIEAVIGILLNLVPVFIVAFAVELLLVSHNVKKIHKILVAPDDPQLKHILCMAGLMVIGMCLAMSLYATLINHGTGADFWNQYILALVRNLPVALFAQLLVVGPVVRAVHMQLFKKSTLIA